MVELQVLNKILKDKSASIILNNQLTEEYFITYRAEFNYIQEHFQKFGNVPDPETFLSEFKEHDYFTPGESDRYLIETLREQYIYSKMVPVIHKVAEMVQTDSVEAAKYATRTLQEISTAAISYKVGTDIVKNAGERKNEFRYRNEVQGLLGITTGIPELDKITHGWLKEDFVIIVGRTNEGKTWVLIYFLVQAWKAGKKVLLYSGEMSKTVIGFRFDSYNGQFSNEALMGGESAILAGDEVKAPVDYYNYVDLLSTHETPFIVVTPKDLGGKRLDIPMLHQLIEIHKPDIVGIDQLSLMDDYRASKGEQTRMRYTHIAEDLYLTSEKYGIPVLSPSQASRASKDKDDNAPGTEHVSESDGIPQNATRQISIKKIDKTLKMTIPKNRYGKNNQELLFIFDPDRGIMKPFLEITADSKGKATDTKSLSQGVDLF